MVVMIKPTNDCNFKNLIGILDEMPINRVGKFSLMDMSDEEKKFLIEKKLVVN